LTNWPVFRSQRTWSFSAARLVPITPPQPGNRSAKSSGKAMVVASPTRTFGERLEQFRGGRVADRGLLENPFECPAEELDEGIAGSEAFLDGGPRDFQAEPGSGGVEVGPGGVGFLQEGDDDHEKESLACELPFANDDFALAGQFVERIAQLNLQGSRDGLYPIHQETPSSHSC